MKYIVMLLAFVLVVPSFAIPNGGPKGDAKPLAHVVNIQVVGASTGPTRFAGNAATFVYNDAVNNLAMIPNVETGSAVRIACSIGALQWENVATIDYTDGGTVVTQDANGADGVNLVTFINSVANNAAVGSALAVSLVSFNSSLVLTDADIVFNSSVSFTTLGTSGRFDIQSIATHEYGHNFGLNHTGVTSATMFPFTAQEATHQRSLSPDDIAGINGVYQTISNFWSTGVITGTITQNAVNVYGGHVVARSLVDGTTQASAMSLQDGTYSISGLAPGPYQVYVEPLDGPVGDTNITSTFFGTGKNTTFQTTFFGGNTSPTTVRVQPSTVTSNIDVSLAVTAQTVNLTQIGDFPTGTGGFTVSGGGFEKSPGDTTFIVVAGPSVNTFLDASFSMAGQGVTFGPNSTSSGTLGGGNGFKVFPLTVASDAEPGPRDIVYDDGTEVAVYCGVIDIAVNPSPGASSFAFGTASPGTAGSPALAAVGSPTINNSAFALTVTNGVIGETAFFFGSALPDYIDLGNGVSQYLRIPENDLFPTSGFNAAVIAGVATLPFPIPNQPSLAGLHIYMQSGLSDAGMVGGVSSTNALVIVFQ